MPPRDVIPVGDAASLGQVIAELVRSENEVRAHLGLPPLRVRTVVAIPEPVEGGN